ncbi:Hypothetical predicted protein [Xyrichtys novacula]|uniref:Uncharacterized protein n=1 Tax=Xyrichtys novacula TaxID=13765 RepID=A0AAV1G6X1_XYRNO|nr:Hypothetical predicted protein [Xyrichtys novacula]
MNESRFGPAMSAAIALILISFLTCRIVHILWRHCWRLTEEMGLTVDLTLAHELQEMPPKQLAQFVIDQGGTEGPERFLDFLDEDEQWTLSNTNNIFNELRY